MKKAFAAMMILCMLLSAVAVAEAGDVAGTWYLNELVMEGMTMNPADMGMQVTMELKEDGTAAMTSSIDGTTTEGTWAQDGETVTVTTDGDEVAFALADGKLSADMGDGVMVFTKDQPEGETFAPAEPIQAAEEDFAGAWKAEYIGMEGSYYPVSLLGSDVTAKIEGTKITLDGFMFSNTELPLEYADGALSMSGTDEESGTSMSVQAQMLEGGMLAVQMDAGETGSFSFYMVRAEEG